MPRGRVCLPMPSAPAQSPSSLSASVGHKYRVLYAEDMAELRDLVQIVLSREGHSVETVPDGAQALARVRDNPSGFDIVITDHHMPLMNGVELVEALRADHFTGKILVFSSEANPTIHEQYRQLRVDLILPKPVFPSALRDALGQLCSAA